MKSAVRCISATFFGCVENGCTPRFVGLTGVLPRNSGLLSLPLALFLVIAATFDLFALFFTLLAESAFYLLMLRMLGFWIPPCFFCGLSSGFLTPLYPRAPTGPGLKLLAVVKPAEDDEDDEDDAPHQLLLVLVADFIKLA